MDTSPTALTSQRERFARLRLFNLAMVALHVLQGVAILLLSTSFALPVTTSFVKLDPQVEKLLPSANTLIDLELAPLIAAFLFISAAAHLFVSLPGINAWYTANLSRGMNYARWWEYAVSASLMTAVIAMLTGLYDLSSLIMIFALTAVMNLWGLMMELHNQSTQRTNWTAFTFGSITGAVPWVVIALYLFAPGTRGPGDVPGFVYGIFGSLLVWYTLFAANMFLQYRRTGPWRDYLFGEAVYIVLSLTAKSALAWQVFAGTLRPV